MMPDTNISDILIAGNDIIIAGKDIPIECVDLSTHSCMSQDFAILVGIINWELIASGKVKVEDFDQFEKNHFSKCTRDKLFGKLMVSINQRSGIHLPDDYRKEFETIQNAKWLTKDMRIMLSNLLIKMAMNQTLKLVKEV